MVDRVILRRYALPRCNCARECDIAILANLQTWNEPQQWNSAAIWYQFLSVVAWHCKYSELGPFQGTSSKLLFFATVVHINLEGLHSSVWLEKKVPISLTLETVKIQSTKTPRSVTCCLSQTVVKYLLPSSHTDNATLSMQSNPVFHSDNANTQLRTLYSAMQHDQIFTARQSGGMLCRKH